MRRALLILTFASLAAPLPALAGWTVTDTTTYQSHPVGGDTAAAIYRQMNLHPIMDPDGGPALANLTHDHTIALTTKMAGGQCKVDQLSFNWHFIITLPKATSEGRLAPRTRAAWNAFLATLKTHEEHHRTIFLDCGNRFLPAAAKLTAPSCTTLDHNVRAALTAAYADCMLEQVSFDRHDHPHVMATPFIQLARSGG